MVEPSQYASTTKYIVKARFDVEGVVEKPDVVGAVFGQTEGLFGPDLDLRELQKEVAGSLRGVDVIEYGPEKLPAGPEAERGDIIVVEGRADVILLMKTGIKNVIALNGTKVPDTIIKLTKDREVTAFLDGDRAGDLILKELTQVAEIDYVARAPFGKEVEELTPKEVMRSLRERVPINQARPVERQA